MNPSFWNGKRVFLTGHTGFKGSWLSLWLQELGAELTGYALDPSTNPSLFEVARVGNGMNSVIGDIRDLESLTKSMFAAQPEIVIHMAAQPLVRRSYSNPIETYSTNVMGTVNVLETVRKTASVKAVVNVTTDKCYENKEWHCAYREDEPMGGYDPYSSSKACSELITSAYRRSFFETSGIALASARAGNVIGGGDWSEDRLIPDILRSFEQNQPVLIRYPHAIRPWQHVLEPLLGYLVLAEQLYEKGDSFSGAWNFGPFDHEAKPVQWIVEKLIEQWNGNASWLMDGQDHPHEAKYLKLDISKARNQLGWSPKWDVEQALSKIMEWHQQWLNHADMNTFCIEQINHYWNTTPSPKPQKLNAQS